MASVFLAQSTSVIEEQELMAYAIIQSGGRQVRVEPVEAPEAVFCGHGATKDPAHGIGDHVVETGLFFLGDVVNECG